MDEFGVLTEKYGLKPQGKSAPMAASKPSTKVNNAQARNLGFDSGLGTKSSSYSDSDYGPFRSNTKAPKYGALDDYGDLFGGLNKPATPPSNSCSGNSSFDYDSIFMGSKTSVSKSSILTSFDDDQIFGGMPGFKSSVSMKVDDLFGSFPSSSNEGAQIDDLLGDFGRNGTDLMNPKRNGSRNEANSTAVFDELIPGFGGSSSPSNGTKVKQPQHSTAHTSKSVLTSLGDPFVVLESTSTSAHTSSEMFSDPLEQFTKLNNSGASKLDGSSNAAQPFKFPPIPKPVSKAESVKSASLSPLDELENFATGGIRNYSDEQNLKASSTESSNYREAAGPTVKNQHKSADDIESFFSMNSRSRSAPKSRATKLDPVFDVNKYNKRPEVPQRSTSVNSASLKKSSSATNIVDDLSSVFGAAPVFSEFQEVEGESEERRRARLDRIQRMKDRMDQALANMNQRDLQNQQEQEERHRIAESLDGQIKSWAAGKEGNLRALLSSLHIVLWPQCGWRPVSLTDLITSTSVKKVYQKATLCVHPDKVQQKGANLEQKYTAEKVFDVLKEAWNKFSKEELS